MVLFYIRADDPSGEVADYSVAYVCAKRWLAVVRTHGWQGPGKVPRQNSWGIR